MHYSMTFGLPLLVCLAFPFLGGGSSFGDPPTAPPSPPGGSPPAKKAGRVSVGKFTDVRDNKPLVGEVRNGYGIKTAQVLIGDQDAGAWVANALASELERNGMQVTKVATSPAAPSDQILITGNLTKF